MGTRNDTHDVGTWIWWCCLLGFPIPRRFRKSAMESLHFSFKNSSRYVRIALSWMRLKCIILFYICPMRQPRIHMKTSDSGRPNHSASSAHGHGNTSGAPSSILHARLDARTTLAGSRQFSNEFLYHFERPRRSQPCPNNHYKTWNCL